MEHQGERRSGGDVAATPITDEERLKARAYLEVDPFPECRACRTAGLAHCAYPDECGSGLWEAVPAWRERQLIKQAEKSRDG